MRIGRSIDSYFFSSFPPPFSFIISIFTFIENTYLLQFQLSRPNIVIANSLRRKNLVKKLRDSQRKKKTPRSDKFLRSRNHKSENKRRRTVWLKTRVPLKSRCAMRKAGVWMRNRQKPQRIAVLVTRFCQSTRRNSIPGRRSRRLLPPLPPFPLEKKESGIEARLQEAVLTGPF